MPISIPFPVRAVFLDLDGTLADTIPDLADAVDEMLVELKRPPLGVDRVMPLVGKGIPNLVRRCLNVEPGNDGTVVEDSPQHRDAVRIFRRAYAVTNGRKARLYPGVREGLDALQAMDLPMACITNKSYEFSESLLEQLDLMRYFSLLIGGDTLPEKKPHPLPLLHACRFFAVQPATALMVGDSANDIAAARAAGCPVFCVPYGYREGIIGVDNLDGDALVSSLLDIPPLIDAL